VIWHLNYLLLLYSLHIEIEVVYDMIVDTKDMYNLDTAARYSKYKTQLKHNIIQWSRV
jgi:hypothetical protein